MSVQCGTWAGYQRHRRDGEDACEECKQAIRDHQRQFRAFHPLVRQLDRWRSRTASRALQRLAAEFPGRYAELVAEERELDPDPRLA